MYVCVHAAATHTSDAFLVRIASTYFRTMVHRSHSASLSTIFAAAIIPEHRPISYSRKEFAMKTAMYVRVVSRLAAYP